MEATRKFTIKLTDQEFLDTIDTAGYGINYWAQAPCVVDDDAVTYEVRYHSDEDGEPSDDYGPVIAKTITKPMLEEAWGKMLTERPVCKDIIDMLTPDEDGDADVDAWAADALVQFALWGKVVFG